MWTTGAQGQRIDYIRGWIRWAAPRIGDRDVLATVSERAGHANARSSPTFTRTGASP